MCRASSSSSPYLRVSLCSHPCQPPHYLPGPLSFLPTLTSMQRPKWHLKTHIWYCLTCCLKMFTVFPLDKNWNLISCSKRSCSTKIEISYPVLKDLAHPLTLSPGWCLNYPGGGWNNSFLEPTSDPLFWCLTVGPGHWNFFTPTSWWFLSEARLQDHWATVCVTLHII